MPAHGFALQPGRASVRALPWPRLAALAGLVAGVHWWAIDVRDPPRPEPVAAQAGPVLVMSASPSLEPAFAHQLAALDAPPLAIEPPPAPRPTPPAPRRVVVAPGSDAPSMRPALAATPQAEAAVAVALQVDERRDRSDAALPSRPADAPAAETSDTRPAELLAQAGTVAKGSGGEGSERPVPTYRTRPPAEATLAYRLSRGPIVGTGQIDWRPGPGGVYSLQLEGSVPIVGTLITQVSRGRIDASGLAPERHTDRRLRRGEQAANFDRAAGRISFSGQAPELPLTPGVQDRVSVMIQLPAIVNAWGRLPPVGEQVLIRVVGARGDAHVWSLRFEGVQAVDLPDGRVNALRFLREPEGLNDTRAEFWLDPARQHLPVKMVLTDGKGEALELLRTP